MCSSHKVTTNTTVRYNKIFQTIQLTWCDIMYSIQTTTIIIYSRICYTSVVHLSMFWVMGWTQNRLFCIICKWVLFLKFKWNAIIFVSFSPHFLTWRLIRMAVLRKAINERQPEDGRKLTKIFCVRENLYVLFIWSSFI